MDEHMGEDMDMHMDDMTMSMPMYFGKLSDYKVQLLFEWWDVQEKWQFALTWLAVCCASVVYHAVRNHIGICEEELLYLKMRNGKSSPEEYPLIGKRDNNWASRRLKLKLIHSSLSALNYGLALLQMLVAMTYNPMLFIALLVGFFLGDYLFFRERDHSYDDTANCH